LFSDFHLTPLGSQCKLHSVLNFPTRTSYIDCFGNSQTEPDTVDCSCACRDVRGNCLDPGCHATVTKQPGSGCGTGVVAVCNNCAGGWGGPIPACVPTVCGGVGPEGRGCVRGADINCVTRNNLSVYGGTCFQSTCLNNQVASPYNSGCVWDQIPNEPYGRCSDWACRVGGRCIDQQANITQCGGGGCDLIDMSYVCKDSTCQFLPGETCGYKKCTNMCNTVFKCGIYPCNISASCVGTSASIS